MPSNRVIVSVLALCFAYSQSDARIVEKAMNTVEPLDVKLSVRAVADSISVDVQIQNCSDHPILIEKIDATLGEPLPHEFLVKSEGKEVEYIGPMIKRAPYKRDDFRWLRPGDKIGRTLNIRGLYDFRPGSRDYEVTYLYLGYNEGSGKVTVHRSKPIVFTFSGKAAASTASP